MSVSIAKRKSLLGLLVLLLAGQLGATEAGQGLQINDFPDARVLFDRQTDEGDYALALGLFERSGDQWVIERQQHFTGAVTRRTLELPSGSSPRQGFDHYVNQLKPYSPRALFRCTGRECGNSSRWANNHFGVIQLHGREQYQYYAAYELTFGAQKVAYLSLYAVRRANGRVYVQRDLVMPSAEAQTAIPSSPNTLAQSLKEQGYAVFPGLSVGNGEGQKGRKGRQEQRVQTTIRIEESHLEPLVRLLKQNRDWQLALVGHDYVGDSLSEQRKNSLSYAEALKAALEEADVEPDRLDTFGLGSLAPAGRGGRSARIELVLL